MYECHSWLKQTDYFLDYLDNFLNLCHIIRQIQFDKTKVTAQLELQLLYHMTKVQDLRYLHNN